MRLAEIASKTLRPAVAALGVAYPLSLAMAAALLRWVGERWWVTAEALYLPAVGFAAPLPFVAGALVALRIRRLLVLQTVSAALLLFPLMGFVLPGRGVGDPRRPTIRVLSFNTNSDSGGTEAVVAEIDRHSPDVVLLQETGDQEALGHLLRERYPTVKVSTQFVMASRYPLVSEEDPPRITYDERPRSARFYKIVLDTPVGRVTFYDVHPVSPRLALFAIRGSQGLLHEIESGRFFEGAAAPMIRENAGLRRLQVQAFAEAAGRESNPVVVAGDTNLPSLSPLLHAQLSRFEDGFVEAGWGFGYTFPTDKGRPWMRIDRIMASEQLRFTHFEVGESTVSDHRCVVADLQLR